MASTYLTKTFSGAGNRKKWTWSAWVKKHQETSNSQYNQVLFGTAGGSYDTISFLTTPNSPKFFCNVSGNFERQTNAFQRDCFGWYHLVITFDSAQSTAADRLKMYVNGVQQSSFSDNTNGNQNDDSYINSTDAHQIGRQAGLSRYGEFSMSHVHFCDGYAYAASDFGSFDNDTGEWKINTSPSVSYGTNGFFILKDGNSLTDQSPNTNNWSVGAGTLTKTEDSPSNIFATLNPLAGNTDATFSHGNTKVTFGTASSRSIVSTTLGAINGRYYWEMKVAGAVYANNITAGVGTKYDYDASSNAVGSYAETWGITPWNGQVMNNGSSVGGTWATFASGDIMQFAINLVEEQSGLNKFYIGKNGTWLNGADPSNHSSTTGVVGITKPENGSSGFVFPLFGDGGSSATPAPEVNFGNGYFGTTAVSSAGTNASGNGIFEYDVPTGFTALSTKGLNL